MRARPIPPSHYLEQAWSLPWLTLSPVRQQVQLTKSLYAKRHRTVAQIPNFWPLVLEQAPPDIDQHIQPSDSALLLSSLTALTVTHFELEATNADRGDPRSVAIRWEFAQNAYFEDAVLEKRFWHRRTRDGWAGLVSEPVAIRWKKGKDLTGGLLDMVKRVWDEEQLKGGKAAAGKTKKRAGLTAEQRALKRKIEDTGLGGLSFFAWFGYVGRRVSAAENELALAKEEERRKLRREGKPAETTEDADENEDAGEDEEDEEDESLEIFPDGDELAIAITQDLWPGAIKYFSALFFSPSNFLPLHSFRLLSTRLMEALQPKHKSKML